MTINPSSPAARWIAWPIWSILVFLSAFSVSGTRQSPLELDPSWHAAIEYASEHHFQFGTQIVFTFGPLGFLTTRTSLGHLIDARILFAFFWSAVVALAATTLAKRLPAWVRYAFLAWLILFTLSEGIDQAAFFVMACGTIVLLIDNAAESRQARVFAAAFIVLALIKFSFLTAGLASLSVIVVCRVWERKIISSIVLPVSVAAGFVAVWMALGQSPRNLVPWLEHGLQLTSGYSGAMNLLPKPHVLLCAVAAMLLFIIAWIATSVRAQKGILPKAILLTVAQYVFLAWKEGFTRSGDWHAYVFLWFLPLGIVFCFIDDLSNPLARSPRLLRGAALIASMVLCVVAGGLQLAGFPRQQVLAWPRRLAGNAKAIVAVLRGRTHELYADCYDPQKLQQLALDRAKDVIGSESVDVMNYLALAPVANGLNYQPRPVFQGFVAYSPALQQLNEQYFQSADRPHFVLLSHDATDGRFPALEDSAAFNQVLNNYVPVARDGRFLVLQQRTAQSPEFQLLHEQSLHFGEKLDLEDWTQRPLFMSVEITPNLVGRAATLLYQPDPIEMHVESGDQQLQYRVVPSMALRPFLLNPLLESNFDVIGLYTGHPGKQIDSVTFERHRVGSLEFHGPLTVRLYTVADFPHAARQVSGMRILADVQGRVFWPDPQSVEFTGPRHMVICHGTPALLIRGASKIVIAVPESASAFSGFTGIPQEIYAADRDAQSVEVEIEIESSDGKSRVVFERRLQPTAGADDRTPFRIPIDAGHDRTITLTSSPVAAGGDENTWSAWSQCRFDEQP